MYHVWSSNFPLYPGTVAKTGLLVPQTRALNKQDSVSHSGWEGTSQSMGLPLFKRYLCVNLNQSSVANPQSAKGYLCSSAGSLWSTRWGGGSQFISKVTKLRDDRNPFPPFPLCSLHQIEKPSHLINVRQGRSGGGWVEFDLIVWVPYDALAASGAIGNVLKKKNIYSLCIRQF